MPIEPTWKERQAAARANADPATRQALDAMPIARMATSADTSARPGSHDEMPERRLHLTPASAITPRPVQWLWHHWIALGTLALLAGREGIGKSSIAYLLTSWITRGVMPGAFEGKPRAVIIAATEDSWEHTIVPRLMAARANLDMVYRVDVGEPEDMLGDLSLPADLDQLAELVVMVGAAMILLDPLSSRLHSSLDTHKDAEVRQALEPLVRMADVHRVSILGIIHVNKSGGTDPTNTIMGSRAFSAVPRSVLYAMTKPGDESTKLLGLAKNNLGPTDLPTMTYSMVGVKVGDHEDGEIWTGRVELGEDSTTSIAEALAESRQDPEKRSARQDAAEWLAEYMKDAGGSADSAAIKSAARKLGIAESTLHRARKDLALVDAPKEGTFPKATFWSLQVSTKAGDF